jgi:hypothetical protein
MFRSAFNPAQDSDYSSEAREVKLSAPFRPEGPNVWHLGNITKVR